MNLMNIFVDWNKYVFFNLFCINLILLLLTIIEIATIFIRPEFAESSIMIGSISGGIVIGFIIFRLFQEEIMQGK
jgi:hypothetical protein